MQRISIYLVALFGSCTSHNQVNEVHDRPLTAKSNTIDGDVGINSDNQAVIRKKSSAGDELRVQDMVNMRLRDQLESDLFSLKECRQERADRRLGGDGRVIRIPDIDDMAASYEVREQMGLDSDGNLTVVREQFFEERLKAERQYEATLRTMIKTVKLHLDECSLLVAEARRSIGLPGRRTTSEGYFDAKGNWIESRRGATTLDDEFEIQADRKRRKEPDYGH